MTGRYLAFEGIEGAGKSTVAAAVATWLQQHGIVVVAVREPGGTPLGEQIRHLLLDPGGAMVPWAEAMLFSAARSELAAEVVGPALAEGSWVVSDRSVYSSLAYQGGGRTLGIDDVRSVNEAGLGGVWPELVILLRVEPESGLDRQHDPDRIGGAGIEAPASGVGGVRYAGGIGTTPVPGDRRLAATRRGRRHGVCRSGGAMDDLFDDVIGHGAVIAMLRRQIDQPSQAYLFVGPSNAGKGMVARRFAALLLAGDDERGRRRALAGNHPDLILVEPDGRSAITVDQVRHTVSQASLAPMEGQRKVFLFEDGGMMNDEAANALLKTLEEPTRSTIFVIVTESEHDLPDTIASRCRTIVFGRVGDGDLVTGLEKYGIEPEQAQRAALISGGRPGLAMSLATRPEVAEFRHLWLSVPLRLTEQPGDAYLLADEIAAAAEPLLSAIRNDQAKRAAEAERQGTAGKALKERHERELRRATGALFISGLEILAGFYRDAAAAQFGAAVRNPDIPTTALTGVRPAVAVGNTERVLDAIEALEANQRPVLAFANLFADLGAAG